MDKTTELLKDLVAGAVQTVKQLKQQGKKFYDIEKKIEALPTVEVSKTEHSETIRILKEIADKETSKVEVKNPVDKVEIKGKVKLDEELPVSIVKSIIVALGDLRSSLVKAVQSNRIRMAHRP